MKKMKKILASNGGMEMVQVAILVALAVGLGIIFKSRITAFVTATFDGLSSAGF